MANPRWSTGPEADERLVNFTIRVPASYWLLVQAAFADSRHKTKQMWGFQVLKDVLMPYVDERGLSIDRLQEMVLASERQGIRLDRTQINSFDELLALGRRVGVELTKK